MKSVFFIDGFNMYHALDNCDDYHKYKWLDLKLLAENIISNDESIEEVLYFTAYCTWDRGKKMRHKQYVEALTARGVQTVMGKFSPVTKKFNKNVMPIIDMAPVVTDFSIIPDEIVYKTNEEKRTDVNMATKIVDYAYQNKYDHAYIVTADGDIAPAIETARKRFPEKKFTAVLPIGLSGQYMCKICDFNVVKIDEDHLKKSQLPDLVVISTNRKLSRPPSWSS
ncbi:NYN domain-containing protein [Patescibacteria group bacterium]|nr:NYN domain-containing protein [Patescibacteria group bacterium]